MDTRIWGHGAALAEAVSRIPALQKIMDEDPKAEISSLLHDHIKDSAFLVGYDFLGLIRKAGKIIEENGYDKKKIRRRIEEHLRKYPSDEIIIGLALFLGIPVD